MPITYYTAAGQPAFTTETQENDYTLSFPLGASEPSAMMATANFVQVRANYSRPSANSVLTINSTTFYFDTDANFTNDRGPITRWQRSWATVPTTHNEFESFVYEFPAYTPTSLGSSFTVTAITYNAASFDNTLTTATAHGLSVGNIIFANIRYTYAAMVTTQTLFAFVLEVPTTTKIRIRGLAVIGPASYTAVGGTIQSASQGRLAPKSIVCDSRVQFDYALTTVSSVNDVLPLVQPWAAVDSTGAQTTELTSGTIPSAASYAQMVAAGGTTPALGIANELIVECTRERYAGNIYVRKTRYVPAL